MDEMKLMVGRTAPNRFTVIERDNCVIVEGFLSMAGMKGVTAMVHKNAIVSPQLAGMLGASFAFGLAKDVEALIAAITPAAEDAARHSAASRGLSNAAAVWLASGERGNSSETMFTHLTGVNANRGSRSHPYDPADMRRCLLLLDQCPEMKRDLHRMADVSPAWARLVRDWNAISITLLEEWGDIRSPRKGASAPRAYNLIKNATGE